MNPWIDAIDKLRFHGYSVTLIKGRFRYTYQSRGNPPQEEITASLEGLKAHKAEALNDPYSLIEQTLQKINEGWEPGALEWIKANRPDEWAKMFTLERSINKAALEGNLNALREALGEYHRSILATVREFRTLKEVADHRPFSFVERPKSPWDG